MAEVRPLFSETIQNTYHHGLISQLLVYHSRYQIDIVNTSNDNLIENKSSSSKQTPLFCDNMWPGSLVLADYLCCHPELVFEKVSLELGAAMALPSMIASVLKAKSLVITDYPTDQVLENIELLFKKNSLLLSNLSVSPHIWGQNMELISQVSSKPNGKFDVIFLAELLWKDTYSQHENLLQSIVSFLDRDGIALLSFAHRPTISHTKNHDLEFLEMVKNRFQLSVDLLEVNEKYCDVDESIPTQVFLYKLYYPTSNTVS